MSRISRPPNIRTSEYFITGMAGAWYLLLATTKDKTHIITALWWEFHIKNPGESE